MTTPTTSSYATSDDLLAFTDARTIKDLLIDDGSDYSGELSDDTTLNAILQAASGQFEAACGVSNLYTPLELATLSTTPADDASPAVIAAFNPNTQFLIKQLVCSLAMVMLVRRRPEKWGSDYWQAIRKEVEDYFDRLRRGERLFDDPSKRAAGVPAVAGPTTLTYQYLNLIQSRTRNYFPSVAQRLPLGRQ